MDLQDTDFALKVDDKLVEFQDWKSAENTEPPPAWIVVLLDASGSMKLPVSQGTTSKFQGALLIVLVALAGGGILPFWMWAQSLKREAQEA